MAMVVQANKKSPGIGGHISTYASAATLYEIGFNHFFKGPEHPSGPDMVFFQGHASPGIMQEHLWKADSQKTSCTIFEESSPPEGDCPHTHTQS